MNRIPLRLALGLALVIPAAAPLAAQRYLTFNSAEVRVGAFLADELEDGFSSSFDVGLGYVFTPIVQTTAGLNYFSADVTDRLFGSVRASGSLSGVGVRAGVRAEPLATLRLSPFVSFSLMAHRVSVDGVDESSQTLLEREFGGYVIGGSTGVGVRHALERSHRWVAVGELRRVFVTNVPHWAGEVGVRFVPRGRGAYGRPRVDPLTRSIDRLTDLERARQEREAAAVLLPAERGRVVVLDDGRRLADAELRARQESDARAAAEREAERLRAALEEANARIAQLEARLDQSAWTLDRLLSGIAEVREMERGFAIVLGDGFFATGRATLSPRARTEIGRVAAVLMQYPEHRIRVEGHTDAVGSEAANQQLSEQRAAAVRAALIAEGVDPARVDTVGYGQSRPVASNDTAAGRAQNRRVEIVVVGARRPAGMER